MPVGIDILLKLGIDASALATIDSQVRAVTQKANANLSRVMQTARAMGGTGGPASPPIPPAARTAQLSQEERAFQRIIALRQRELVATQRAQEFGRGTIAFNREMNTSLSAIRRQEELLQRARIQGIDTTRLQQVASGQLDDTIKQGIPTLERIKEQEDKIERSATILTARLLRQAVGWTLVYSAIRFGFNIITSAIQNFSQLNVALSRVQGNQTTLIGGFQRLKFELGIFFAELTRPLVGGKLGIEKIVEDVKNASDAVRGFFENVRKFRIENLARERESLARRGKSDTSLGREIFAQELALRGQAPARPAREIIEDQRTFIANLVRAQQLGQQAGVQVSDQLTLQLIILKAQEEQFLAQGKSVDELRDTIQKLTSEREAALNFERQERQTASRDLQLQELQLRGISAQQLAVLRVQNEQLRQQERATIVRNLLAQDILRPEEARKIILQDQLTLIRLQGDARLAQLEEQKTLLVTPITESIREALKGVVRGEAGAFANLGEAIGNRMADAFIDKFIDEQLTKRLTDLINPPTPSPLETSVVLNTDATTANTKAVTDLTNRLAALPPSGGGGPGTAPRLGPLPAGAVNLGLGQFGGPIQVRTQPVVGQRAQVGTTGRDFFGGIKSFAGPALSIGATALQLSQQGVGGFFPAGTGAFGGALGGVLKTAPLAAGLSAIPIIGPFLAIGTTIFSGILGLFRGLKPRIETQVQEQTQTARVTSRIDVTNRELRVIGRTLVSIKQGVESFTALPESFFFSARRGNTLEDQIVRDAMSGLSG